MGRDVRLVGVGTPVLEAYALFGGVLDLRELNNGENTDRSGRGVRRGRGERACHCLSDTASAQRQMASLNSSNEIEPLPPRRAGVLMTCSNISATRSALR